MDNVTNIFGCILQRHHYVKRNHVILKRQHAKTEQTEHSPANAGRSMCQQTLVTVFVLVRAFSHEESSERKTERHLINFCKNIFSLF